MTMLLADIGGTNARFCVLAPDGRPGPATRLTLDPFPGIAEAIETFLAASPGPRPEGAVLAVAGPVAANRVMLTNRRGPDWVVDGAVLAARLGLARGVEVVNDFAALAWSLPQLGAAELRHLGGAAAGEPGAPMVVLGPGTGLGVAAFLPEGDGGRVLPTEGGHAALAAGTAREAAVIEHLRARFDGHVSAERGALSGQGIENLHAAIAALDGLAVPDRTAAEIVAAALAPEPCPVAAETLSMFCALLGGFAGDLALMFGARGGVFIGGGISPRFPDRLAASDFRARFEAKGRFRDWLAPVPAWLILHPDPAMLGLAALAARMADGVP
jgi:glucokinase